jgi:hypothetical protein
VGETANCKAASIRGREKASTRGSIRESVFVMQRPDWTLVKRAYRVWLEDDATTNQLDHETLAKAFARIYKLPIPVPREMFDDGDAVYKRLVGSLVVCESYPGNSGIYAWPILLDNDPITIVLKWPNNALGGSRLLHTFVYCRSYSSKDEAFQANNDDRSTHRVFDHTITWITGHIDFASKEALALLRAAEQADKEEADSR